MSKKNESIEDMFRRIVREEITALTGEWEPKETPKYVFPEPAYRPVFYFQRYWPYHYQPGGVRSRLRLESYPATLPTTTSTNGAGVYHMGSQQ